MGRGKITIEEPFEYPDLKSRVEPHHRIFLVKNSPRGILLDEFSKRESWGDLGYVGDQRRNRYAIEVRARNGRVVAAVAWWIGYARVDSVSTLGTYVSKTMRRRGIGTSLWQAMISVTGAKTIFSEPVTNQGLTLVESLREKLKGVEIKYIDSGDLIFLEDLRARKRPA